MNEIKGFAAYEIITFPFTNINYGGHSRNTAHQLVKDVKGRWAWCSGNTLTFVPNDYQLKMCEHFLNLTHKGYEIIYD